MSTSNTHYLTLLDGLRRREDLLRILIFTLVTVLVWISFEIYLSQKQTKVAEDFASYTLPLNPNIDRTVLQEIQNRRGFSDEELQEFSTQQTSIITEDELESVSTPSAEIEDEDAVVVTPTPTAQPSSTPEIEDGDEDEEETEL